MTKQKAPVVDLPRALYMWRRSREHLPGRPPTTTIQRDLPPFKRPSVNFHPPSVSVFYPHYIHELDEIGNELLTKCKVK